MVNPKVCLSVKGKCDTISVKEVTDVYVTNTNAGGWGSPNINTGNIVESTIEIFDLNDVSVKVITLKDLTIDLYAASFLAPTPCSFTILEDEPWDQLDGIYKVVYTLLLDDDTTVVTSSYEIFICNLINCKSSVIKKLIKELSIDKSAKLKVQVDQLELFVYGIMDAFTCGSFTEAKNLLSSASEYCSSIDGCGCGC